MKSCHTFFQGKESKRVSRIVTFGTQFFSSFLSNHVPVHMHSTRNCYEIEKQYGTYYPDVPLSRFFIYVIEGHRVHSSSTFILHNSGSQSPFMGGGRSCGSLPMSWTIIYYSIDPSPHLLCCGFQPTLGTTKSSVSRSSFFHYWTGRSSYLTSRI